MEGYFLVPSYMPKDTATCDKKRKTVLTFCSRICYPVWKRYSKVISREKCLARWMRKQKNTRWARQARKVLATACYKGSPQLTRGLLMKKTKLCDPDCYVFVFFNVWQYNPARFLTTRAVFLSINPCFAVHGLAKSSRSHLLSRTGPTY